MDETVDSRQAILSAARRLFMEQGFRGIAMRQIAEAVGVTKAALYYHFHDKEELFVAVVESYLLEMASLIDEAVAAGGTTRTQVGTVVRRMLTQPVEQRAVLRLASQELSNVSEAARRRFLAAYHERFVQRIADLLQRGIASGELRPVDPTLATWTLLGMMYPYSHPSPPPGRAPTSVEIDQLLSIFFDGMAQSRAG